MKVFYIASILCIVILAFSQWKSCKQNTDNTNQIAEIKHQRDSISNVHINSVKEDSSFMLKAIDSISTLNQTIDSMTKKSKNVQIILNQQAVAIKNQANLVSSLINNEPVIDSNLRVQFNMLQDSLKTAGGQLALSELTNAQKDTLMGLLTRYQDSVITVERKANAVCNSNFAAMQNLLNRCDSIASGPQSIVYGGFNFHISNWFSAGGVQANIMDKKNSRLYNLSIDYTTLNSFLFGIGLSFPITSPFKK
jgi:O-acetylhomoserine/O-acetylserine sulfhydrylase-like pyridoxal-dependent enzyme